MIGRGMIAVTVTVLLFAPVTPTTAQGSGFSGLWRLDDASSQQLWEIQQSPSGIILRVLVGDREASVTSRVFGGPPVTRENGGVRPTRTIAALDSAGIVFRGAMTLPGGADAPLEESWQLAQDGESFSVARTVDMAGQATVNNVQRFVRIRSGQR